MIIATLVFFVLATFISIIYIKNRVLSNTLGILFLALVIVNIGLMVMNDRNHFGMKNVTEEKKVSLYSAAPKKGMDMLLYQPVGTKGKENVYVYKNSKDQKKPVHTKIDSNVTNKVVTTNKKVELVQQKKIREYKNGTYKLWFGVSGNNHQIISRKNIFYVNKSWLVLSTQQAKELQKIMKDKTYQAKLQAEGKDFVGKAVMESVKNNPQMNEAQKDQIIKEKTSEFQMMKIHELVNNLKK